MNVKVNLLLVLLGSSMAYAQKKPLDHSVYDQWQSITNRQITNNGKWAGYTVAPQEGDEILWIQRTDNSKKISIPRGTGLRFTADSKIAVATIKPFYKDIKAVRDKKLKKEKLAKDTLALIYLETGSIEKIPNVQSFKIAEKGSIAVAYLLENLKDKTPEAAKPEGDSPETPGNNKPLEMIVRHLQSKKEDKYANVIRYTFNAYGDQLAFITRKPEEKKKKEDDKKTTSKDSLVAKTEVVKEDKSKPKKYEFHSVNWLNLATGKISKVIETEGDFNALNFDEPGNQLAFVGTDSPKNALIKDYKLYYFNKDSNKNTIVETEHSKFPKNWRVSENGNPNFSKDGKKLFFGIQPKPIVKDTALIANDHAILDIWGYKDESLQTIQLKNLPRDLKKSYITVLHPETKTIIPLSDEDLDNVRLMSEGNSDVVLASTDNGTQLQSQWTGSTLRTYYLVNTKTGQKTEIIKNLNGNVYPSPQGKHIVFFNRENGNWYQYNIAKKETIQLNKDLNIIFTDEENDVPDLPRAYGFAAFTDNDESVLIKDRYDLWEFNLNGKAKPRNITNGFGRANNLVFETFDFDPEIKSLNRKLPIYISAFNKKTKENGLYTTIISGGKNPEKIVMENVSGYRTILKAKQSPTYIITKESNVESPNLFATQDFIKTYQLSNTNPQQKDYVWNTNELIQWTTPKGYTSEGILYKPENFDASKKYPMIVYFYEKLSDNLNKYQAPAPTPSRLMISFFVSNGYLVFTPDIAYEDGYPGASAEEYINSGVEYLKKNSWVDGSKIGIQGQSWGGYQVAHLITRTNMYAAAWSGAPVVNMTSAYGGIRWTTGMNRQFQYEKTQSRIGKTLWEAHDLYIENSPLFYMDKVNTPVAIMHNDKDGAVPWYQGIEMFTALKRLGKPAWLLNYNNDDHNLVKRQNRKDISIRQLQFFNHYLKGEKAPVWMTKGIPAVKKGIDWGFELTDDQP